jgi:orotate phosphoribosyltransferase
LYARTVRDAGLQFDVVFGPAYKGIPLATVMALGWQQQLGSDVQVAYNRKEVKDHGEVGKKRFHASLLSEKAFLVQSRKIMKRLQ